MATQLIMTVGTNPLPVWVAWYHLRNVLTEPIQVRLVHTDDTVDEKDRLARYCKHYCSGVDFLDAISTSPGRPDTVHNDVQVILNPRDLVETTHLHVHYTGGTKVMSVETVAALEYDLPTDVNLSTSYLDPRGSNGPVIVDSHSGTLGPDDARKNVPAELALVANLNGFTPAPFFHEYYDTDRGGYVREELPPPQILDQDQKVEGNAVLDCMREPYHPRRITDSTHFEYAAYIALEDALNEIKTGNPSRSNYKVFNKVHVRRMEASIRDKPFELDVVAVLGYQIVVVSCTLERHHDSIKEKGMEVILRARQLGGDEAQAIVLCQAHPNDAPLIQRELHDEVGSAGAPLRVWGTDKWTDLSDRFKTYLQDGLHWR